MSSSKGLTLDEILNSLEKTAGDNSPVAQTPKIKDTAATSSTDDLAGLLAKTASTSNNGENTDMNAQQTGNAIAQSILMKLASNSNADVSMADPSVSNKAINDLGVLVAQQNAETEVTPVENLTVTETARALLERGAAAGAVRPDSLSLATTMGDEAYAEGNMIGYDVETLQPQNAVPSDLDNDEVEKTAALIALVNEGHDFDTAHALVKQAEALIAQDELEQIKIASINRLVNEGFDITSAVYATEEALEKVAGARWDATKSAMGAGWGKVKGGAGYVKDKAVRGYGIAKDHVAAHPYAYGVPAAAIGTAGLGAAGYGGYRYMNRPSDEEILMAQEKTAGVVMPFAGQAKSVANMAKAVTGLGVAGAAAYGGAQAYGRWGQPRNELEAQAAQLVAQGYTPDEAYEMLGVL